MGKGQCHFLWQHKKGPVMIVAQKNQRVQKLSST